MTDEQLALIFEMIKNRHGKHHDAEFKKVHEVTKGLWSLLELCGDDPDRLGLRDTPFRVLKAFMEYTQGFGEDPKKHLLKTFKAESTDLIIVKDIEFHSVCEHHFAPFFGKVHIGYIPSAKITGLSKLGRLVDGYAQRFQLQERLTAQIADAMVEVLKPEAVMVKISAKHMCMCGRGVKKSASETTTLAARGLFEDDFSSRAECLTLLKN